MSRWITGALLLGLCAASWGDGRVEPNAFLATRADTVPQLIREVNADSMVASRYERHFGKTKDELVQYFGTLHLAKLNEDGTYKIYSVDDQGVIKVHAQHLKSGTRVFADSNGVPILKASCGNALVPGTTAQNAIVTPEMSQTTAELREVPLTTPVAEETLTSTEVITPASPIALTPAAPNQISVGSSNQGLAIPAVLGALGGAAAFLGGGGHAPVPEPASIVVMAGALAALRCRRKKAK